MESSSYYIIYIINTSFSNVSEEKLTAAGTPKHVLVQSVCRNKHWVGCLSLDPRRTKVKLLSALKAGLCKAEHEEGEDEAEKEEELWLHHV